jgi:hypothetical protein
MSGNTVPITAEERWFKDGVDVNVGLTFGLLTDRREKCQEGIYPCHRVLTTEVYMMIGRDSSHYAISMPVSGVSNSL